MISRICTHMGRLHRARVQARVTQSDQGTERSPGQQAQEASLSATKLPFHGHGRRCPRRCNPRSPRAPRPTPTTWARCCAPVIGGFVPAPNVALTARGGRGSQRRAGRPVAQDHPGWSSLLAAARIAIRKQHAITIPKCAQEPEICPRARSSFQASPTPPGDRAAGRSGSRLWCAARRVTARLPGPAHGDLRCRVPAVDPARGRQDGDGQQHPQGSRGRVGDRIGAAEAGHGRLRS